VLEQLSARVGSHAAHAPPPTPHAASDGVLHVDPEQQPEQESAQPLHTFAAVHVCDPGHATHSAPPEPQADPMFPASHLSPVQHPVGHDVASQTQVPARQCCPELQAGPDPH
jgi:hypothetical protein